MVRTLYLTPWLLAAATVQAASLETHLDRQQVEMGDILTLTLTLKGLDITDTAPQPDFKALEKDFQILGQQRNTQLMMHNGDVSKFEQWQLQLTPRHPGTFLLPAISLGSIQSQPLQVSVKPAPSQLKQAPAFFLRNSVDVTSPYVQQQVRYQVRLYYQGELINGAVAPPTLPQAQIIRLNEQNIFHKQLQGIHYTVFEWNYALFPQRAGQLTLPPQGFTGQLYLNQKLKQVSGKTPPITLSVRPIPTNWPAGHDWLPSTQVTLKAQWQGPDHPKAGDSLTLTLTLHAEGVRGEQLPQIKLPDIPGVRIYAEPVTSDTQRRDSGLSGSKTYRWTLLLTQPGQMTLPAVRIPWWDVKTDRLRWVEAPTKTLEVVKNDRSPSLKAVEAKPQSTKPQLQPSALWPWQLATALLALISLILAFWLWRIKKQQYESPILSTTTFNFNKTKNTEYLCQMSLSDFYHTLLRHPALSNQTIFKLYQQLQIALFLKEDKQQAQTIRRKICQSLKKLSKTKKIDKNVQDKLNSIYP